MESGINVNIKSNCNFNWAELQKKYNVVIVRPNKIGMNNILTQFMMVEPYTKYVIIYKFDLNGATITMPQDCIIEINGGDLSNGTIIGNHTILLNPNDVDILKNNIELNGTWKDRENLIGGDVIYSKDNKLIFADKEYNPAEFSGLGKIYLKKNIKNIISDGWYTYNPHKDSDSQNYLLYVEHNKIYNTYDEEGEVIKGLKVVEETNSHGTIRKIVSTNIYNLENLPEEARNNTLSFTYQNNSYTITLPNLETVNSNTLNTNPYLLEQKNILESSMMTESNTIYVISFDYDLVGNTLQIPENCTLDFQGGSITNGVLIGNNTTILNTSEFLNDESLTLDGAWKYVDYFQEVMNETDFNKLNLKRADTIYYIVEE